MKKLILSLCVLSCFNVIAESNSVWLDYNLNTNSQTNGLSAKDTIKKRSLVLDESLLKSRLNPISNNSNIISSKKIAARAILTTNEISLPLPDGSFVNVTATPSQVISDEMAQAHPEIKTWKVMGVDNPEVTGVVDFTSKGFHGMLMMPDGDLVFIDPDKKQSGDIYNSISKKENAREFNTHLNCDVHDDHTEEDHSDDTEFAIKAEARIIEDSDFPNVSIADIKTYRLALTATAEYTANQGGTAGARSSMVTSINRINPIFERDLGISLQLIDAPELIFSDPATDPFPAPNSPSQLMIDNGEFLASQNRLDEFDIGHVLSHKTDSSGGSGVAFIKVACLDEAFDSTGSVIRGLKAAGATTSSSPTGEIFDLVLLAHELGHQLGANHSFNSAKTTNCSNGRSAKAAVEPGSGSSIMSYNSLCGSDDLPENPRDDFFHFASISQVVKYTRTDYGSNCGVIATTSLKPTADAGDDISIPANTPFILDGTASGGIASWDQIDIGGVSEVDVDNGENAIIRHIIPTEEQDRYIPNLADLFADTSTMGEIMPTTTRELNFAYVVRDNAIVSDKKLINVTDTNSVFSVTSQTSDQIFITNQSVEITWDTAKTELAPISCSNVDIHLIRENGVKNALLTSTPNDGTQRFIVPDSTPILSNARVLVGCSGNSFFNISTGNITIEKGVPVEDTTEPEITILGENLVSIIEGTFYIDPGATALDNIDGAVAVTSIGNVDTNAPGTYIISYSATDAAGNSAFKSRTIEVIAETILGNNLGGTVTSSSGGGSIDYWFISLLTLLGLRRAKQVRIPIRTKCSR